MCQRLFYCRVLPVWDLKWAKYSYRILRKNRIQPCRLRYLFHIVAKAISRDLPICKSVSGFRLDSPHLVTPWVLSGFLEEAPNKPPEPLYSASNNRGFWNSKMLVYIVTILLRRTGEEALLRCLFIWDLITGCGAIGTSPPPHRNPFLFEHRETLSWILSNPL